MNGRSGSLRWRSPGAVALGCFPLALAIGACGAKYTDKDGDGSPLPEDCNDDDPRVHPGAIETDPCDGENLSCRTVICDFFPSGRVDEDQDGFSVPADCDDHNGAAHPGARDLDPCDAIDEACDGQDSACDALDAGTNSEEDAS